MAQSIVGIKVDGALTVVENGMSSINKALDIRHDGDACLSFRFRHTSRGVQLQKALLSARSLQRKF